MAVLLAAGLLLVLGAALCGLAGRAGPGARGLGVGAGLAGCAIGAVASGALALRGAEASLRVPWSRPIGSLALGIDALSAFFALCVFAVGGLALLHASGYFAAHRRAGTALAWLQILVVAMAGVVLARDAIGFLLAWELMFLASYLLVGFEDAGEETQRAAFTYLVASQIGVVFLFVLFGLLAGRAGGLSFEAFAAAGPLPGPLAHLCFGVALVAFGTKAGLWPLHGWLPVAHPAAPSPVSALMSGAMIKLGIYGLLRTLAFLGEPPASWGVVVLAIGAASALGGVLLALAQHDLKRLLAYHSVENVGIISLGIGIGLLGRSAEMPAVALVGFAGALLHTLNHGLFKGLLFQAAGAVVHVTGSRDVESLGGILRRMPVTGALFFIGAVAISGLPPLNGFASELLVYVGALQRAALEQPAGGAAAAALVVPLLALVGALAAACFVKAFGVVFLGEPRSAHARGAHEVRGPMRAAMLLGAAGCVAIGIAPGAALALAAHAAGGLAGTAPVAPRALFPWLETYSIFATGLVGAIALVAVLRWLLLRGREVRDALTWDCGYAAPTPRMQYTAASFAEPVLAPFAGLLRMRVQRTPPEGFFPERAAQDTLFEDPGEVGARRVLGAIVAPLERLRAIQRGPVQLYLLYVLVTVLALLVWQVPS